MMRHRRNMVLAALVVTAAFMPVYEAIGGDPPTLRGIGYLPGTTYSEARAISADGRVVVGYTGSAIGGRQAIRWTATGGVQALGSIGGASMDDVWASAVSADGSVVVGESGFSSDEAKAWRWTQAGGMTGLGLFPFPGIDGSGATGVSADGSVVVGYYMEDHSRPYSNGLTYAFRQPVGGAVETFDRASGVGATGVSADGSVAISQQSRWTLSGGTQSLPEWEHSSFSALSGDGAVVAGRCCDASPWQPFLWSEADGMVLIDNLAGSFSTTPNALSADGSVMVGIAYFAGRPIGRGNEAFIWTAEGGTNRLQDVLATDYGMDLTGWMLLDATGVSADGWTIVGNGIDPEGHYQGWIVTLPEPATLSLLALGGLVTLRRRRRIQG